MIPIHPWSFVDTLFGGWPSADDLCTPMVTWSSADTSDLQILGGGGVFQSQR